MSSKEKPRLHLVRGGKDPDFYDPDLDWYFGCYDSECGLQSVGIGGGLEYLFKESGARMSGRDEQANPVDVNLSSSASSGQVGSSDLYTDHHVGLGPRNNRGVFTRGRQIWQRLKKLDWSVQEMLRELYSPRQFNPAALSEATVRALHLQWRMTGAVNG